MKKKTTEYHIGDKFVIEDPAVRAQVREMMKKLVGLQDTITHLAEIKGVLQFDMWDLITKAYPDLLDEWVMSLDYRTGKLEVKYPR